MDLNVLVALYNLLREKYDQYDSYYRKRRKTDQDRSQMDRIITSVKGLFVTHPELYGYLEHTDSLSYQWFKDDFPVILERIKDDIDTQTSLD